jgi:long-chain acyl-CoA synthetase
VPITNKDRVINFLPLAHIFERGWSYLCLTVGAELILNTYPKEIQQSMRETHPTCMSSVPRFWEKVFIAVKEKIGVSSKAKQMIFRHALSVGRKYNIDYLSRGKRPPLALALEYKFINNSILSLVRKEIGLENANFFPTAGAYVSPEVEEFVHSVGIDMIVGYGLTESLATVSCDHRGEPYTIGSVGRPIEGIDIKISENNEILLKGPTITCGYFNRDDVNKTAFDADGYFHTGDAGYMRDGELFLTERIKDLYKTSNGKYIAPQMVEAMMLVDKYIDQIAVIADQRKFVSALVVPEFRVVEEWAREKGLKFDSREELCANQQVHDMLMERVDTLQQRLAHYEQVKRITLIPHHFSMESGELTNTLKLKRSVISKNYKDVIDKMYVE